jgi:hypothetical protein
MSVVRMSFVSGLVAGLLASCDGHAREPMAADGAATTAPVTAPANGAEARVHLDETLISGSQDLPKVLYIVPWQTPTGRPLLPLPDAVGDEDVLRRIHPAEHHREVRYRESLRGRPAKE